MTARARSHSRRGTLILIGGAEDRKGDKLILRRVVESNDARRVAVIPTASQFPRALGEKYTEAFGDLGVKTVEVLDIRRRSDAESDSYRDAIRKADAVFFTGGDQVRLIDLLERTPVMDLILRRFGRGMTIAGTSAGAAAAGDVTIYEGNREGYLKGTVQHARGFGLLQGITVDTHFLARGRISRLTQHMASGLSSFGIGLAEDTGIEIYPDDTFLVIGKGVVTVLNGQSIGYSNYDEIRKYDTITVEGIQMSYLSSGTLFDMKAWKVVKNGEPGRLAGAGGGGGRGEGAGIWNAMGRIFS